LRKGVSTYLGYGPDTTVPSNERASDITGQRTSLDKLKDGVSTFFGYGPDTTVEQRKKKIKEQNKWADTTRNKVMQDKLERLEAEADVKADKAVKKKLAEIKKKKKKKDAENKKKDRDQKAMAKRIERDEKNFKKSVSKKTKKVSMSKEDAVPKRQYNRHTTSKSDYKLQSLFQCSGAFLDRIDAIRNSSGANDDVSMYSQEQSRAMPSPHLPAPSSLSLTGVPAELNAAHTPVITNPSAELSLSGVENENVSTAPLPSTTAAASVNNNSVLPDNMRLRLRPRK
jgi:hypothetical protein